jgi:hypothetical protein
VALEERGEELVGGGAGARSGTEARVAVAAAAGGDERDERDERDDEAAARMAGERGGDASRVGERRQGGLRRVAEGLKGLPPPAILQGFRLMGSGL